MAFSHGITRQPTCSVPPLPSMQGKHVLRVACGAEHSLCATSDGEVFAFGWGRYGGCLLCWQCCVWGG